MVGFSLMFHVLITFGAFQALFISTILLTQKNSSLPKKFFSLFLVIEGITLVERLLVETDLINAVPHLLGISYPISFIKAPVLFLMGLAIVNTRFKLRKIHSLHFLPFVVMLGWNIPFYFQSADFKLLFVAAFMDFVPTYQTFEFYLYFTFFLHIGTYVLATIIILRRYKVHVKNNRLANWYLSVLWLYGGPLVISFIYFVIRPTGLVEIPLFNTISMLIMTFLVQSIAYTFFARSNIFNNSNAPSLTNIDQLIKDEKLIRDKLENEKVYLDDSLNLSDFAKSMDLSKKYVSDLINQRFGSSFKDLINHYRVEEAKAIMRREADSKTQLIDIAQDSGFNNKVSFYRAFKRFTSKSPSEYFNGLSNNRSARKISTGNK